MKKIIVLFLIFFTWIYWVWASNTVKKASSEKLKIYKYAILSRSDIRDNMKDWEKIIDIIELSFNKIRKNKDVKKFESIKSKTWEIIKKYNNKKYLTIEERKLLYVSKNLFFRSYIELINFWKIKL